MMTTILGRSVENRGVMSSARKRLILDMMGNLKKGCNRGASIGDWDRAGAVDQFMRGVDAKGCVNGRVEVRNGNRILHDFFREVISLSIGPLMFDASSCKDERKC